jgi:predicted ATP-dependent endonuclease of OLD family
MDNEREERYFDPTSSLKVALSELSAKLSFDKQKFVASISTDDIVSLLTAEFAKTTEEFNRLQKETSDLIINKIKLRTASDTDILASIQKDIELSEEKRREFYKPFTVLAELIKSIFQHKGITLNTLTIGEVSNAISSDKLSAGEKQMLSFLCYNTFTKNNSIFIDEPELSLHPDWQRTLVPTLLQQGNGNQFFMATHRPFIYSKYPEKEIILANDKGE